MTEQAECIHCGEPCEAACDECQACHRMLDDPEQYDAGYDEPAENE